MLNVLAVNPLKPILQILVCSKITRPRMPLEVLRPRRPAAEAAELAAGGRIRHFLVGHCPQELAHPEAPGVACCFSGGEHVVRANTLSRRSAMV
jgi:hypothetical protein